MEVRPVVRRRRLGKHPDDDSEEPRDLWHCRPPSLAKAALSLAMGNALTSVDFARSAVAFGDVTALLYSPRYLSHSADSTLPAFLRSTCGSGYTGLPYSLLSGDLPRSSHQIAIFRAISEQATRGALTTRLPVRRPRSRRTSPYFSSSLRSPWTFLKSLPTSFASS